MNTQLKLLLGLAALLALAGTASAHWQIDMNDDGNCDDAGDLEGPTPLGETDEHACVTLMQYILAWQPGNQ